MTKEQEILNNMKHLHISREEAEQLYNDDHSDEILPEVKEMEAKAKELGRRYEKSDKPRKAVQRTIKPDLEKCQLINLLNNCLQQPSAVMNNFPYEIKTVNVANQQREVTFTIGNNEYSITLTKHRKKEGK